MQSSIWTSELSLSLVMGSSIFSSSCFLLLFFSKNAVNPSTRSTLPCMDTFLWITVSYKAHFFLLLFCFYLLRGLMIWFPSGVEGSDPPTGPGQTFTLHLRDQTAMAFSSGRRRHGRTASPDCHHFADMSL